MPIDTWLISRFSIQANKGQSGKKKYEITMIPYMILLRIILYDAKLNTAHTILELQTKRTISCAVREKCLVGTGKHNQGLMSYSGKILSEVTTLSAEAGELHLSSEKQNDSIKQATALISCLICLQITAHFQVFLM